jgi:hypothetical protein
VTDAELFALEDLVADFAELKMSTPGLIRPSE